MEKRLEYIAQLSAIFFLVAGCFWVLRPFLTATLLAAVVVVSTWPLYQWLLRKLRKHQNIAALAMTFSLGVMLILPLALVAYHLSDNVTVFYNGVQNVIEHGPPEPPPWLKDWPIVGKSFDAYWHLVANSKKELLALQTRLLEPAKDYLLAGSILLGQGVIEMSLAAFVSFFFYRHGETLMHFLHMVMDRVVGNNAEKIMATINDTVRAVMFGLLGTATTQGLVATLGFYIAGIPAALLLGIATFMVSMVPIGPPLIWGGATLWLFATDTAGWGIFMLLWGFLISSVDNIVEPMLVSHGSKLPLILGLFGIMGGMLAFGFVGLFIGPTLLAVGYSLIKEWTESEAGQ